MFSLFLSFVCLHYLCWGFLFGISSSLVGGFFFRTILARLQGVNESISSKHVDFLFFFVSMGIQKGLTMSQRLRPTELVENTAGFFFFLPLLFYSHCAPSVSPQLSVSVASLYGSSDFFFKQPFSSVSLFLSATFLASLILTPSFLLAAFLPLLPSMCEALLINKRQTRSYVFVCVCLRDGRQLSDSIVSLSTSPHSTAHPATGFLPPSHRPSIHPGPEPGRRLRGPSRRPGRRLHCRRC